MLYTDAIQQPMELIPAQATHICGPFSLVIDRGMIYYYNYLSPVDCHPRDDRPAMLLRIARLRQLNRLPVKDLMRAFGVSRATVKRVADRWKEQGDEGFYAPRRGQGRARSVMTPEMVRQAEMRLAAGLSQRACAAELGVSTSTFNENVRAGVIRLPAARAAASERSQRSRRDRQPAAGRACHDTERRQLAANGLLQEATPRFTEPALAVRHGGVLAALPALLREGLLSATQGLLRLPAGFYGLTCVLLLLAFMALARVRNVESLGHQPPGEWGRLLGLDRAPEVKTLRRKIGAQLADSPDTICQLQRTLTRHWLDETKARPLTLSVDGHVKVYSGQGRLPRHFIARQKLCLPASVSYWVNALGGEPLLCLHQPLDAKMVQTLEHEVVPELRALGLVPPTDRQRTTGVEPTVTLVFDREGWSPALFLRLAAQGVACITWHKNAKGDDWPAEEFTDCEVPIDGPAKTKWTTVRLAERRLRLRGGPEVRQIRRLMDDGRQVPLITTHPKRSMAEIAGALFSRWAQENFFKYMRDEFNLDALLEHALQPVDLDRRVVNPEYRAVQKIIDRVNKTRARRLAKAHPTATADQLTEIAQLEQELVRLKAQRRQLRSHVRVGDLPVERQPEALPPAKRLFIDLVRMIGYRAETRMMPLVGGDRAEQPTAHRLLRTLLAADANLIPDHSHSVLRVELLGLANGATERALRPVLDELNRSRTCYPGTELRMVYDIAR